MSADPPPSCFQTNVATAHSFCAVTAYFCSVVMFTSTLDLVTAPVETLTKSLPVEYAIRVSHEGLCYDDCNTWFHSDCQQKRPESSSSALDACKVSWIGCLCNCPNYNSVFSYHSYTESTNYCHPLSSLSPSEINLSSVTQPSSPGPPLASSSPHRQARRAKAPYIPRPLRLLNVNFQNKTPEFWNLVDSTKPDIIIIGTESWLTPDVHNSEIFPPQLIGKFHIFRRDREQTLGGGVFIAVSNDYICTRVPELETNCEIIWVKFNIVGCKTLYICAYYNPSEGDEVSLSNFDMSIRRICNRSASHIWIAGDINIPGFDWRNNFLKPSCNYPELTRKSVDSLSDNNLTQLITEPTRGPSTLDVFITSNETLISNTQVIPGLSDHEIVYVKGDIKPIIHRQKRRKVTFYKKADWEGLRQHMANFTESFLVTDDSDLTADDLWQCFRVELNTASVKFISHKLAKSRNGLPYLTKDIKRLMRKRDK